MAIDIQQEQIGSVRVLTLGGRLDTETAVDVELALQDLLAAGEHEFLIDLSGIGYVSSAGLRVLLSLAKQLDGGKGSLRLCGLNAAVTQVFDVAGFSKLFAIFPDRAAALPRQAQAKPDNSLALKAAALLGAPAAALSPAKADVTELARFVAILLGIKLATAAKPAGPPVRAASAPSRPAVASAPASAPAPATGGLMSKLRGLFGGKR
ncbi:MAG: STAS domain-containing protein [Rudaea sp.]|nr:STAS domain-containing protein [Rudaea sp.]